MRWTCFFAFSTMMLRAGVVAQHDYDAVTDAVVSWRLEPGTSVGQSITNPSGAHLSKATGFRVKLQRLGDAADLEFRLGTAEGKADVASGRIRASTVVPGLSTGTARSSQNRLL